jgi:hypothetical protein
VARHVDQLAGDEVIGGDLGADIEQRVFSDAEFGDASLQLDFSLGKLPRCGLATFFAFAEPAPS